MSRFPPDVLSHSDLPTIFDHVMILENTSDRIATVRVLPPVRQIRRLTPVELSTNNNAIGTQLQLLENFLRYFGQLHHELHNVAVAVAQQEELSSQQQGLTPEEFDALTTVKFYAPAVDPSTLHNQSVAELKRMIKIFSINDAGCIEKEHLVQRISDKCPLGGLPAHSSATNVISQPTECAVCMCAFKHQRLVKQLPCCPLHCFHVECIQKWLQNNNTCPMCRSNCKNSQVDSSIPVSTSTSVSTPTTTVDAMMTPSLNLLPPPAFHNVSQPHTQYPGAGALGSSRLRRRLNGLRSAAVSMSTFFGEALDADMESEEVTPERSQGRPHGSFTQRVQAMQRTQGGPPPSERLHTPVARHLSFRRPAGRDTQN